MPVKLQYGPTAGCVEKAAIPLKAMARRNGYSAPDRPVGRVDLLAAVYGADQWCRALRTRTLEFPAVHGKPAVVSLAAILARAVGARDLSLRGVRVELPRDEVWERLSAGLSEAEQIDAVLRVVSDLTQGSDETLRTWTTLRLGSLKPAGGPIGVT